MLTAVLFDMDGTLIDSEPVWVESIRACLAERGIVFTSALEERTAGLSNADGLQHVMDAHPEVPIDPAELAQAITTAVAQRLMRRSCAMPGADALLMTLNQRRIPLALVSSSPRGLIDRILARMQWDRHFQLVLSIEEVGPGKPDPTVYREALRRLGVAAATSLAVEDTLAGVQAAQGAGLPVVAIPSYPHEQSLLRHTANAAFASLAEAAPWILARCDDA
ncbi:MAG: HAD family phosphatase [Lentisphaerae bacterium]|nr:HAD family phosphatase [Lentisphaerota bacterium]